MQVLVASTLSSLSITHSGRSQLPCGESTQRALERDPCGEHWGLLPKPRERAVLDLDLPAPISLERALKGVQPRPTA